MQATPIMNIKCSSSCLVALEQSVNVAGIMKRSGLHLQENSSLTEGRTCNISDNNMLFLY